MGNCGFWSPEWAHQVHSSPVEASQEGKWRSHRTYESHRTVLKKEKGEQVKNHVQGHTFSPGTREHNGEKGSSLGVCIERKRK